MNWPSLKKYSKLLSTDSVSIMRTPSLPALLKDVRACTLCAQPLAARGLSPRPVLQVDARARILVVGQAPGRKVHDSGIPFNDASGERLRQWMGVESTTFYDPASVAILPMGFCYPGTGSSGDLPPRPECAPQWRNRLLAAMPRVSLTLVIGQYAMAWHLPERASASVTDTVKAWRDHAPDVIPLPHPSPRNNIWLKANPWFNTELVPVLQARVAQLLTTT
jgi:uracil-DNA glycosylase